VSVKLCLHVTKKDFVLRNEVDGICSKVQWRSTRRARRLLMARLLSAYDKFIVHDIAMLRDGLTTVRAYDKFRAL
jgi:hypothetical protein